MAYDWNNAGQFGLLGGFLPGDQDPTKAADKFYDQIPGQTQQYYQPYMDAGKSAIPTLQGQFGNLLNDPGGMINKIGAGYKQSPGFQYALQQALAGSDRAAAAGGYTGLPQHSAESEEAAQGLASKDYNQYLQNALSQYGLGLQGEESLFQGGQKAGSDMGSILAQTLAQRGNLAFKGASDDNAQKNSIFSSISSMLPYMFG